jgi:hypothetical protein
VEAERLEGAAGTDAANAGKAPHSIIAAAEIKDSVNFVLRPFFIGVIFSQNISIILKHFKKIVNYKFNLSVVKKKRFVKKLESNYKLLNR